MEKNQIDVKPNPYYIDLRKQIEHDYDYYYDYDSLGVIDDYLTRDIDIQSAAVIYDFGTFVKNTNSTNSTNSTNILHIFGVLLFDIYGHFNLFKKIPLRVKFKKCMNYTQDIEIPEELEEIIGDRQPYMYECFHWSSTIIDKIFLGKIKKTHIDQLKEILLSIHCNDLPIVNSILMSLHSILPEKNVTLFEYMSNTINENKNVKHKSRKIRILPANKTRKIK